MTNDRRRFSRSQNTVRVPLIEGRHIGQYRNRAKAYLSGEGRAAVWTPQDLASAVLRPQWYVDVAAFNPMAQSNLARSRVGFCDITGQTNERTLLAARIPAGVLCGNKVPTLTFPVGGEDREDLFLALVNSFVVDWLLRRQVTTTVNFFLLDQLVLPVMDVQSPIALELTELARRISRAEGGPADAVDVARWRARVDALVAQSWGLDLTDIGLIFEDFPLIDRGQPPLGGENRSTVTRDIVLAGLATLNGVDHPAIGRAHRALAGNAIPYQTAEHAKRANR